MNVPAPCNSFSEGVRFSRRGIFVPDIIPIEQDKIMWRKLQAEIRQQQTRLDQRIQECVAQYTRKGGRIFCGRGCRGCCTLTVNCTFGEALLVTAALTDDQSRALDIYVARLRERLPQVADLKSYLRMQRRELGDCPFLDPDGACGVYPARPFACRALLATRPADWCAVDFGELPPLEKQLFMASLDRAAVDFPTHYLAEPREIAQKLESTALLAMAQTFGVSLSGNLPYLVWLEQNYRLSKAIAQGPSAAHTLLTSEGLDLPYVLSWGN